MTGEPIKLKSGCIFWPQIYQGPSLEFGALDRDIECDVAIVGGGISGALAAYHLMREGIHTVLVDRRPIGHGSTAASTGLLLYEIDTHLTELADHLGRDHAIAAYRASLQAVLAFAPLVEDLGDRCGLIPRPSLYLASEERDVPALRRECEARRSIEIDVRFVDAAALRGEFGITRPAAVWSKDAFEVDPFRLTLRLIHRSVELGLEVFGDTEIARHEPGSAGVVLHTSQGARIRARKVVFATGYETSVNLPKDLVQLNSTYALASEPLPDLSPWPQHCLMWETSRPYLYLRTTEDGRAIVGGGDEHIVDPRRRDELLESKATMLCQKFSQLFPALSIETTCAWAGTFAQTRDGLPYIGEWKEFPNAYFALGYGGNGITFSLLAAQIIRDLFLGRETELAHLFRFDR